MWFLRFLWFSLFFVATRTGKPACTCGYGGACLRFTGGSPYNFPCDICDKFSRGYYNSCTTITDHCQSSPCARGRCIQTFGAYYCDCPKDYFGKNCDIFNPFYSSVGISNEVNAYHQFQPDSEGMSWFHFIYDPKDEATWEKYGIEIRVNVTVGDRRRYFPLRHAHFVEKDLKEMCLKESSSQLEAYDARVCDLLPEGRKWTYTVDTTLYAFSRSHYREFKWRSAGVIANFSMLTFQVQAITKQSRHVLYEHSYPVFSYVQNEIFDPRMPHRCEIEIDFRQCSTDELHPRLYTPGELIHVKAIHRQSCTGVTYLEGSWYIQRNLERIERIIHDPVPKPWFLDVDEDLSIEFERRFFTPGLHMLQFAYKLRGEPPNFGVNKDFTTYGACWIKLLKPHPNLGFAKGSRRFVSCYRPFSLEAVSFDSNYSPLDFIFYTWCDNGDDKECDYRPLTGSVLVLYKTPCDKTYKIYMKAEHRRKLTAAVYLTNEITFVQSEVDLFIECFRNCHPINPEFRTMMSAKTYIYQTGAIAWEIKADGKPIDPSLATIGGQRMRKPPGNKIRLARIRRTAFSSSRPTMTFTYKIMKGSRGFCEYEAEAVNLKYYVKDFHLIDLNDGRYKFERRAGKDSNDSLLDGTLSPMHYWIYSVDTTLEESLIEVETLYEEQLTFKPHYNKVQLCLRAPVNTLYAEQCTSFLDVKVNESSELSLTVLQALFKAGDTRQFMSKMALYLSSDLKKSNPNTLQWTITLEERQLIVSMCKKAFETELYMQSDDMLALVIINAFVYSDEGCKDIGINRTFVNEKFSTRDFRKEAQLHKIMNWAVSQMPRIANNMLKRIDRPTFKLRSYPYGFLTSLILRSGVLALHIGTATEKMDPAGRNVRTDYANAERNYWSAKVRESLYPLLKLTSEGTGKMSNPFEGLQHEGTGSVHVWSTKCSYDYIVNYFNKTRELEEDEKSMAFVDHFFEARYDSQPWFERCDIQLPPMPDEWRSEIFSMTVTVYILPKSSTLVAPVISIDLRRQLKISPLVHKLPGNLTYTITLPTVINSRVIENQYEMLEFGALEVPSDVVNGTEPNRNHVVYKVTFEAPFKAARWYFLLGFDEYFTFAPDKLKIQTFYDYPPAYEDILGGEWYNFTPSPFEPGAFFTYVPLTPPTGGSYIPRHFYLGIIPSEGMEHNVVLDITKTVKVCYVLDFNAKVSHACQHNHIDDFTLISCNCQNFGIVRTKEIAVYVKQYVAINIEMEVFHEITLLVKILASSSLLAFACFLWFVASRMERHRNQKVLHYVDDSNPLDKHLLLVGVQTGINPLSGTLSKVAIKIDGMESSSRVHILESEARRSLLPGNDDWFLIPTRNPLGKISSVTLWLNYHLLSDWYCSHIWIRDFNTTKWYLVKVGQWMRVPPTNDTSQQYNFTANEVEDSIIEDEHPEDNFNSYYFKELRNRHLPFSVFYLHNRCVVTFNQRAAMYILRVFSIHALVWVMLEHVAENIFPRSDLDPALLTSVTFNTLLMVVLITAASRIFTIIPELMYSSIPLLMATRMTHRKSASGERRARASRSESSRIFTSRRKSQRFQSRSRSRGFSTVSSIRPRSTILPDQNWSGWNISRFQQAGFSTILNLIFGPAQYRSINVSQELVEHRSKNTLRAFRVTVFIMIILSYGFNVYISFSIHNSQIFVERTFLFYLSLLFDALIFEPALIFARSFFAFVFLGMSNAERNWWIEESKYQKLLPKRPEMDFAEYFETVTEPEYRPLLSTEMKKKRKSKFRWDIFKTLALYALMVLTISTACSILTATTSPALFDINRLMKASLEAPNSDFGRPGIAIKDVIDPKSASMYLTETMADADTVWPNEKYVRNLTLPTSGIDRTGIIYERVGKGRSHLLLGSSKIIFLFLSSNGSEFTVPEEFDQFYKHAYHYLDEGGQLTQPILYFDQTILFDATEGGSFRGASRTAYPRKGHVTYIRLDPWQSYYSKLRQMLDFILFSRVLIPRAGIFTVNYFCHHIPAITTVDVIIEVLPNGISSARMDIESAIVFTPYYLIARYCWTTLAVVALILGILNIYLVCEEGLHSFVNDFKFRMRQWFWLSCFIFAGFGAVTRLTKYRVISEIAGAPDMGDYKEFHTIHQNEIYDHLLCSLIVFVGVVQLVILVHRFLGTDRFKLAFYPATRFAAVLLVLLLYCCAVYQAAHIQFKNNPTFLMFFNLGLREMYPISQENLPYERLSFTIVLTVVVLMKFHTASIINTYLKVYKETLDIRNPITKAQYSWKIRNLKWVVDLRNPQKKPSKIVKIVDKGRESRSDSQRSKSMERSSI